MISVKDVSKVYRVSNNYGGIIGGIKCLFTNSYREKMAIDNISFFIDEGESVGIIGQNGAGKSTLIKMLTGILVPTSGNITVYGIIPHLNRKENAKNIGIVFGQRSQLWWDIPVYDSLRLYKEMYEVSDAEFKRKLELYDDILNISSYLMQPVRQLSFGQRIGADIACSFLHSPRVLFLDEPTIGLDLVVKERILALIYSFLLYLECF